MFFVAFRLSASYYFITLKDDFFSEPPIKTKIFIDNLTESYQDFSAFTVLSGNYFHLRKGM